MAGQLAYLDAKGVPLIQRGEYSGGRHWDITDTIEQLGYRPEDDAERFFVAG